MVPRTIDTRKMQSAAIICVKATFSSQQWPLVSRRMLERAIGIG